MTKAPTAALSLVMVAAVCGVGVGPAAADSVAAAAVETTVVRILGGGVLQVSTPDDRSFVTVAPPHAGQWTSAALDAETSSSKVSEQSAHRYS